MFSYVLVLTAVVMFGFQFLCNKIYQKNFGETLYSTAVISVVSGIVGIISMLLIGKFTVTFTPFTLLIAFLSAMNGFIFTFFAIKVLGLVNLSLFSFFSMIGGMALPFVVGIVFYNESLTVAKIICLILITVSLVFNIDFKNKTKGLLYCFMVFFANGMSGVYSMIFANSTLPKGTATDFSLFSGIIRLTVAVVLVIIFGKSKMQKPKFTKVALFSALGYGLLNGIANYFLLISLKNIPGSMQYPLVTGGVMIVSTIIGFFTASKPTKKDIIAISISFLGMLALLLPI